MTRLTALQLQWCQHQRTAPREMESKGRNRLQPKHSLPINSALANGETVALLGSSWHSLELLEFGRHSLGEKVNDLGAMGTGDSVVQ